MTIKALIEDKGIKKQWLAKKMEVSRQTIYNWSDGSATPSKAHLFLLAHILGVKPSDIELPKPQA